MITYYIGAVFATAYLIAFTIERFKQAKRQHASRQGMPMRAATFGHIASKRVLEAFHGSFFGYITAAMMLSVSMLVAGIYIAVDKVRSCSFFLFFFSFSFLFLFLFSPAQIFARG